MEWKRNGKFVFKSTGKKLKWNGMEMEWKFYYKKDRCKMEWKWNGNGMEINRHPAVELKLNGMEWKRNGNGMERLWRTVILRFGFGNGMEWKWN